MKTRPIFCCALIVGVTGALLAQYYPPYIPRAPQPAPASAGVLRTPEQIDELLSPIALYPDPLVGVMLPAATDWPELQAADQFLETYPGASPDAQAWDDSVKALAHYPQVIGWMDDNLPWTQQLGAAFVDQPADVMNSIQRLRANARASGLLVSTPEQQVIVQGNYISIVPAQQNVVYVPTYDPQILYVQHGSRYPRSAITFGVGLTIGPWMAYDFDWNRHSLWIERGRWDRTRGDARFARAPVVVNRAPRQEWRPRTEVVARVREMPQRTAPVVRPPTFDGRRYSQSVSPVVAPPVPRREPPLTPTGRMTPPPRVETPVPRQAPAAPPSAPVVREPERRFEQRTVVNPPPPPNQHQIIVRPPGNAPVPPPQAKAPAQPERRREDGDRRDGDRRDDRRDDRNDERDRDRR